MSYTHLGAPPPYPFAGDYMALPSMRRVRSQADAIVGWLEQAQAKNRPLEDWVETKIARTSSDIDDVHNFVTNSDIARAGLSGMGNYCRG